MIPKKTPFWKPLIAEKVIMMGSSSKQLLLPMKTTRVSPGLPFTCLLFLQVLSLAEHHACREIERRTGFSHTTKTAAQFCACDPLAVDGNVL